MLKNYFPWEHTPNPDKKITIVFFFFLLTQYCLSQLSCLFLPFSFYVSFKTILKCYDLCSPLSTIRMNHMKLLVGQLVLTYKCG